MLYFSELLVIIELFIVSLPSQNKYCEERYDDIEYTESEDQTVVAVATEILGTSQTGCVCGGRKA